MNEENTNFSVLLMQVIGVNGVICDGNSKGYFNKKYADPLDNVNGYTYTERLVYIG